MKFWIFLGIIVGLYVASQTVAPTFGDYIMGIILGAFGGAAVRKWIFRNFWV